MQLKSIRFVYYRVSKVDYKEYSEEANTRLRQLELYKQLRESGCPESLALKSIGWSRAKYYRLKKRYVESGMSGLEAGNRRPHQSRKAQWPKRLEQQVLSLRKKYPLWGKLKLQKLLEREYGETVSVSTVGRIISKHLKSNKVRPVSFYWGRVKRKRARKFHGHSQRWKRDMKSKQPGDLIQIDHMSVCPFPSYMVKEFKAVCPITKITVAKVYSRATSRTAKAFLEYLEKQLPFPILSIQVDGGSEFRKDFEAHCESQEIPLYVLPPRSPEYNGNVERCNGTTRYEFHGTYDGPPTLAAIQKELEAYCHCYNTFRPHQALNMETPMTYYTNNYVTAPS